MCVCVDKCEYNFSTAEGGVCIYIYICIQNEWECVCVNVCQCMIVIVFMQKLEGFHLTLCRKNKFIAFFFHSISFAMARTLNTYNTHILFLYANMFFLFFVVVFVILIWTYNSTTHIHTHTYTNLSTAHKKEISTKKKKKNVSLRKIIKTYTHRQYFGSIIFMLSRQLWNEIFELF